jgi:hypothetical protein
MLVSDFHRDLPVPVRDETEGLSPLLMNRQRLIAVALEDQDLGVQFELVAQMVKEILAILHLERDNLGDAFSLDFYPDHFV